MSDDDWDDEDDGWGDGDEDGGGDDWGGFDETEMEQTQISRTEDKYLAAGPDSITRDLKGGPTPENRAKANQKIQVLREVIPLEAEEKPDEFEYRIKALGKITEIHVMMVDIGGAQSTFQELEAIYESSPDTRFFDAVNDIAKRVRNAPDPSFQEVMDNAILEAMHRHSQNNWLKQATALCRRYLKENRLQRVEEIVRQMHDACRLPSGDDDQGKADALLNIYALEIELATASGGDEVGLNDLFKKTAELKPSIADSQAMYTIKKCYGFMFAGRNEWERAYSEFFEAFRHISDTAGTEKFECLRYVVLSSMLSDASVNPFASQDARAEESNPNIKGVADMLTAFDQDNIRKFESVLYMNRDTVEADSFLSKYMPDVKMRLRSRVLVKLIKPYKRVRLDWLKEKLLANEPEVEALVVKCILDGSVKGRVDQINAVLDLEFGVTKRDDLYEALDQWMSAVKKMQSNLSSRTSRGGSHMGGFGGPWGDFDDEDFPLFQSDMFGFDGGW